MRTLDRPFWATFAEVERITQIINQGIDSHLEAITKSTFEWVITVGSARDMPADEYDREEHGVGFAKIKVVIHPDDMKVFLRRLINLSDNEDDLLLAQDCYLAWVCEDGVNSECAEDLWVEDYLDEIYDGDWRD